VYGLGAILYVVLTGRPPFLAATPLETVLQVLDQEPVSPRTLRPALSRDIETICLRCLEKDPNRRYASAEELADDLGRYLNHEPIKARPAGAIERAIKWARRRPAVAAIYGLIVVGVVVLGIMNYWLALAQQEEKEARELAQRREREALDSEAKAKREEKKAKQNFELASQAVEEFLTKVSEHPHLKEFDLEDLRKDLLETALAFHRKFVDQKSDDPDVLADQGQAYLRLGKILSDTGKREDALKNYETAEATFGNLVAAHPSNAAYLRAWGASWNRVGAALLQLAQNQKALDAFTRAVALRQELIDRGTGDPVDLADLATSLNNQAAALQKQERKQAETAYLKARDIQLELVKAHPLEADPKHARFPNDLARTYYNLGNFFANSDRDRAQKNYAEAARLWKGLVESQPRPSTYLTDLATCYGNMGSLALADAPKEAERLYLEAESILRRATERHPTITLYRIRLVLNYKNLGLCAATPQEKEGYVLKALGVQDTLVQQHPKVISFRAEKADLLRDLGRIAQRDNDLKKARTYLKKAWDETQQLFKEQPKNVEHALALAATAVQLGDAGADRDECLRWYQQSARLARDLLTRLPKHFGAFRAFAVACDARMRVGDFKQTLVDLDAVIARSAAEITGILRMQRAACLAHLGMYAEAHREADELSNAVSEPELQYRFAQVYAVCLAGALADPDLEPKARALVVDRYVTRALALLNAARKAGFFKSEANRLRLESDPAFAALRAQERFKKWQSEG
jgi:tetratricopeptide (TPR) repeat protein